MRRLAVTIGSQNFGGPTSNILSVYVPSNWWADGHEIIIRFWSEINDNSFPVPPAVSISEVCTPNQAGSPFSIVEGSPIVQPGIWYSVVQRYMVRIGTDIYFWDDTFTTPQPGTTYPGGSTNEGIFGLLAGTNGIKLTPPFTGWNFGANLQFDWTIQNSGTPWPATVSVLSAIALIAPALNLRI